MGSFFQVLDGEESEDLELVPEIKRKSKKRKRQSTGSGKVPRYSLELKE